MKEPKLNRTSRKWIANAIVEQFGATRAEAKATANCKGEARKVVLNRLPLRNERVCKCASC